MGYFIEKAIVYSISVFSILLLLVINGCQSLDEPKVVVAIASNLQFAVADICEEFTERSGIHCEIVMSSSGKLTAQIIEGAPFDIFMSADMKYPRVLFDNGVTHGPPEIYAFGELVIWVRSGVNGDIAEIMTSPAVRKIAVANPKSAPYGSAALEFLKTIKIEQEVNPKLVYGESISQVNQFMKTGVADVGFTSKSVVQALKLKEGYDWVSVNSNHYSPVKQGVVMLKTGKNADEAVHFMDFIFSPDGQSILKRSGYHLADSVN